MKALLLTAYLFSADTIPGSHTGYFEGRTLIYTCSHPNQHGPAWRLNVAPCQPIAVQLPSEKKIVKKQAQNAQKH